MGGLPLKLLARSLRPEAELDQTEALEAMYWLRHFFAIGAGVACGVLGLQGVVVLLVFAVTSIFGSSVFCKYQDLDADEFPDTQPIAMEGLAPSIFLFLLCWVSSYSVTHF